jgi:hypothetical protein
MSWYEELGKACAEEFGLVEGQTIEHQCGTVWVEDNKGNVKAIGCMSTEE